VIERTNLRNIAGATLIGGIMTAGAFAGMGTAQAWTWTHTPKPVPPDTSTNGNPGTSPVLTGRSGLVPTWKTGTFNTATCPGGTCFVPQSTSPFAIGSTPTAQNPIVSTASGTATIIGLNFI
jgi:hypothetical protein